MLGLGRSERGKDGGVTLIGPDAKLEGKLVVSGDVRIEGSFQGELVAGGLVVIAEGARVAASTLRAKDLRLGGRLEGDIHLEGKLELLAKGWLEGSVRMRQLIVEEGGTLQGSCEMITDTPEDRKTHNSPGAGQSKGKGQTGGD